MQGSHKIVHSSSYLLVFMRAQEVCIECAALFYFFTAFSCLACFFPCLPLVVCRGVWYTHVSRNVHASVVLLSVRLWYVVEIQKGSTMKAVATALVLIAGAAVVLWYGNTLNSWVLGGLIGGLAALLLSIPISLMVSSSFSEAIMSSLGPEHK